MANTPESTKLNAKDFEAPQGGSERLPEGDQRSLAADLRAIAARAAAHIRGPYLDHAEDLYDEHGLPK